MRIYTFITLCASIFQLIFKVEAQICSTNPPALIQNSLITGACPQVFTAADQIVRDATQITLNSVTTFSISSWVKISSAATSNVYSLFRLTEEPATTTPTDNLAIRLTLLINRSGARQITVQYSTTGTNSNTSNTAFNFLDDNWMYLFVSYNIVTGYISYFGWQPNIIPANDITFGTDVNVGANFHSALTSVSLLQLLYWGTYTTFCGQINRFVYYNGYATTFASTYQDWLIQGLTDASLSQLTLLYLRLEQATNQVITDFSGEGNNGVLGLTSAVEASDPVSPTSSTGLSLQTGQLVTVSDFVWSGQQGVVVSFWLYVTNTFSVTTDADTTDAIKDAVILQKKTSTNILNVLLNSTPNIKLVINNLVYTDARTLPTNTWLEIIISIAFYTSSSTYYNYYIFKVDYSDQAGTYKKLYTNTVWSESVLNGFAIGSTLNNFAGTVQISQLKIQSGIGVYRSPPALNCGISNCAVAFAKFSSNICLVCSAGFFEYNGICNNACDLSVFGLKNSNILTCSTCSSTCAYCQGTTGAQVCSVCVSNYYLDATLGCVLSTGCSVNFAPNPNNYVCQKCGNSIIDAGETCDDGNFVDYDGCTNCSVDPGYICSGAPSKCVVKCGDGIVQTDEQCDDGNYIDGDGCSNCIVDSGYYCTGAGPSLCKSLCGNGVVDINEQCDDGNTTPNDGCTNCLVDQGYQCATTPCTTFTLLCGNGFRDTNEQCDNGNTTGCTNCVVSTGYNCSGGSSTTADTCTLQCPNSMLEGNEECDDGNSTTGDGCNASCQVESGWYCTNATPLVPSVCTQISTITTPCRDSIREPNEGCDAGPIVAPATMNGCLPDCSAARPGFICQGGSVYQNDVCTPICGDGLKQYNEQCDDGNLLVGDGCDQNCNIETDYSCTSVLGALSVCTSLCGNGVIDPGEQCDDENQNNGDGCSSVCQIEIGYSCTQIVVGGRSSCFLCADNCLQCTSKAIKDCTTCFSNYYQNPVTGTCTLQCSDGYYISETTSSCTACFDLNCKRCTTSSSGSCQQCQNGYYIGAGLCYSTCPYGTYPTLNPVLGNECSSCPFPCAACTKSNDCQACANKYYLDSTSLTCKLCGMDPNCYQCDIKSSKCLVCAIGYKPSGESCTALPQVCGDGYFQPSTEQCDDGNLVNGDGCSSSCKIETNYSCILNSNEGPSICYQQRPTKVTGHPSNIDYALIFISFERPIQNPPTNITQSDIIIKIAGLYSSNYNYTMQFINPSTISVKFNYTKTVQNLYANIDFSKQFKNNIQDIYNYTLTTQFSAFNVPLPYYIYYSSTETQSAVAVSWVYISLSIICLGPIFAYLYYFGQGRVFKYIEVIQVLGLMRFINIRYDVFSYQLFQQADLVFNLRGMYSVFQSVPISSADAQNFADKDNLTLQRQLVNSSFIHSAVGVIIICYLILSILQSINSLLYRFVEIDQITQITEKIKEFMQWDAYIKLFDFLFYFISISIFLELQSISFATPLSIVNLVVCALSLVGILALGGLLVKKYVRYDKLHKRTDWFEKYLTLFDGLKFNIKRAKLYIIYPYVNKFLFSAVLVFLNGSPFMQIILCAGVRAINVLVIIITRPFHFNFMQRRDVICETFLIIMIILCLNCTDDNSDSIQKRIMSIIFLVLSFLFIFGYSGLYLWSVVQEDIYFDPLNIVPLKANPEDWMSQQESNKDESSKKGDDEDYEAAEPAKKNQVVPLDNNADQSGSEKQDDYDIGQKKENLIIHNDEEDDDDIFSAHQKGSQSINTKNLTNYPSQNKQGGYQSGKNINIHEEEDEMDDDESQQNEIHNYQR